MLIVPETGPLTAPFWRAAREGRLAVQRCGDCGARQHPPLPRCARCLSAHTTWEDVAPHGSVYAYTVVFHATHRAFADRVPYAVGLVELPVGVRLLAGLRVTPERLRVGLPVTAVFAPLGGDAALVEFAETGGE